MAPDPAAHGFAGEHQGPFTLEVLVHGLTVSANESRQRIRSPSALALIRVVERLDAAELEEALLPRLHPLRGRTRARTGSKNDQAFGASHSSNRRMLHHKKATAWR